MTRQCSSAITKSKWFMPAFSAALGVVILAASWIGGHPAVGAVLLAVMVAFGLFILLAGARSETIRGPRGDGRDERFAMIDLRATAIAGFSLLIAVIVSWLVEIARGHSGGPFDWLCAVAGISYVLAVAFLRWRG